MTKVRREECPTSMKDQGQTRIKVKRRGPLAPISQLRELKSTTGSPCFLQMPDQRSPSPWLQTPNNNRLPRINGSISPPDLNLTISTFEPDQRTHSCTTVPDLLPDFRHSSAWANNSCTTGDKSLHKDLDFNSAVFDVFNNIDNIARGPLFKHLDKPGLYDDKHIKTKPKHIPIGIKEQRRSLVMENNTKSMEAEETKKIMQFVREKDAAMEEAKKARAELTETQSKLYDAMKLIEELEKKVPAENKKPKNAKKAPPPKKKANDSPSKPPPKNSGGAATLGSDKLYHPPVDTIDPGVNSIQYYRKLAESFPTLPMIQLLDAEQKFMEADTDSSGYIDKDELDKVLSDTVGLFTPKQVEAIFNEVDTNHSESVDFYEVLIILNKLHSKRKTNLPPIVQQNYSKTCSIQ